MVRDGMAWHSVLGFTIMIHCCNRMDLDPCSTYVLLVTCTHITFAMKHVSQQYHLMGGVSGFSWALSHLQTVRQLQLRPSTAQDGKMQNKAVFNHLSCSPILETARP
jgi:hypothetical protein